MLAGDPAALAFAVTGMGAGNCRTAGTKAAAAMRRRRSPATHRESGMRLQGCVCGAVVLPCPNGPVSGPPRYGLKRQVESWVAAPHCRQGKFIVRCNCGVGGRCKKDIRGTSHVR